MVSIIRFTYLQPAIPFRPSKWKIANARRDVTMLVTLSADQKKLSRVGSSLLV